MDPGGGAARPARRTVAPALILLVAASGFVAPGTGASGSVAPGSLAPDLVATPGTAGTRPFALKDVVGFRTIQDLAVSADGRAAVFTVRTADLEENRFETDLWVVPLDGSGQARRVTYSKGTDSSPRWSPDGKKIAFLSERGGAAQVWALPADGDEAVQITSHAAAVLGFDWAPDARRLLVVAPAPETEEEARRRKEGDDGYVLGRQWRNGRLWLADLSAGAALSLDPVAAVEGHVREDARWSADGSRIACITTPTPESDAAEEARIEVIDLASRRARAVPGSERASAFSWSPDGGTLAFIRPHDGKGISREDVFLWPAGGAAGAGRGAAAGPEGGGAAPRNVSAALDRDAEKIFWSADGRAIDVLYSLGAAHVMGRIEAGPGRRAADGGAAPRTVWTPGHSVGHPARSGAGWAYVRGDRPDEIWLVLPPGEGRPLTRLNEAADGIRLPASEAVRWRGPAGEIEGILIKPGDHDPKRRYPLIVRPHGGPRLHASDAFDLQSCYLASRGFLVLKPNFRGSTGYGDDFTKGNVADWGEGPFRDMMAGADMLIAKGLADVGRLFAYGWSYGGYLVNWAVTHTDRFRAAASGAGVADLRMQYAISDARRWRFDYFAGSPFGGHQPIYDRESPVTHARGARVPTLFVHGEKDERCPLAQGLMMHRALADNGVETELIVYPREGHDFSEPRHVMDRIRRVADWFERHDRPSAAAPGGIP